MASETIEEKEEIMPIPNHCVECDKPVQDQDSWLCDSCKEKEKDG